MRKITYFSILFLCSSSLLAETTYRFQLESLSFAIASKEATETNPPEQQSEGDKKVSNFKKTYLSGLSQWRFSFFHNDFGFEIAQKMARPLLLQKFQGEYKEQTLFAHQYDEAITSFLFHYQIFDGIFITTGAGVDYQDEDFHSKQADTENIDEGKPKLSYLEALLGCSYYLHTPHYLLDLRLVAFFSLLDVDATKGIETTEQNLGMDFSANYAFSLTKELYLGFGLKGIYTFSGNIKSKNNLDSTSIADEFDLNSWQIAINALELNYYF